MARLLSLLLTLALVTSIVIPGGVVSRCNSMGPETGTVVSCCPMAAPVVDESCCCLDQPAPTPATLPSLDRHWLVGGSESPVTAIAVVLWSYAPTDVPTGAWRAAPVLAFGGAPPPRERSCIILT